MNSKLPRSQISITVLNEFIKYMDTNILLGEVRSRGEIIEKALREYKNHHKIQ